jgi:hypothetical protein
MLVIITLKMMKDISIALGTILKRTEEKYGADV